ncbi:hypothetical protein PsYK624_066690 [Phanerochaete sordida]|uniref:Jacalin-type lectin domain-containing protein n=1 Tax=Phanerochaete sordida TaxID=48140 RepID=A0A9P3GAX0_9APHY|nr:hypothetical protein PsYK624_066690 [Phanerochaete sordida]
MAMKSSITLAAANYPGGLRCYTKLARGMVRGASLALSDKAHGQAMRDGNSDIVSATGCWTSFDLPFEVHEKSSLCTFAWDAPTQSVFYQDKLGKLCEQRLTEGKDWELSTSFHAPEITLGTNIASVASLRDRTAILFYQHHNGKIYYTSGSRDKWDEPKALSKTEVFRCTGIGAASWDDLAHVRVYIHNESHHVREWSKDADGAWTEMEESVWTLEHAIDDITAIGWGPVPDRQLRLYIQEPDNTIVEFMNTQVPFARGTFHQPAMKNSDIIGFVLNVDVPPGFCINIMWAGADQVLQQRIYDEKNWLSPSRLVYLDSVNCIGKWDEGSTSDDQEIATTLRSGAQRKSILELHIRASKREAQAIGASYTDRDATPLHGKTRGKQGHVVFSLRLGEDITTVWYRTDEAGLASIQFGTSDGSTTEWFGSDSGKFGRLDADGHALIGFVGAFSKSNSIAGIMPIWSQAAPRTVYDDFVDTFNAITEGLPRVQADCVQVQQRAAVLQTAWGSVELAARDVMSALTEFTESVDMLYGLEHTKTSAQVRVTERRDRAIAEQVNACNSDAKAVAVRLEAVLERVVGLPAEAEELLAKIGVLQVKACQADLEGPIRKTIDAIITRKQEHQKELESRERQIKDATNAANDSAVLYAAGKAKGDATQNGTGDTKRPQNPFGAFSAPVDREGESRALCDAREQAEKDESEPEYHVAHRDFIIATITHLERDVSELESVVVQVQDTLMVPAVTEVFDQVAALEARLAARGQEIAVLVAVLWQITPLCDQLAGKADSKAFAKALLPVVEKVDAHDELKGLCSKVEGHILLAVATQLAA